MPSGTFSGGMSRLPGLHSLPEKRLSTVTRRYSGLGSSVVRVISGMSGPRLRLRSRSAVGFSIVTSDPLPGPVPKSKSCRSKVGTPRGTTTASAVATEPTAAALVREALVRTPKEAAPGPRPPVSATDSPCRSSGRPQRLTCSFSSRNSITRNPAAVSTNTGTATPVPSMLTGTL